jgi:hypothetical protein
MHRRRNPQLSRVTTTWVILGMKVQHQVELLLQSAHQAKALASVLQLPRPKPSQQEEVTALHLPAVGSLMNTRAHQRSLMR